MKHISIFIIIIYQRLISPYFPQSCRFQPTCSNYMREAIEVHGFTKGIIMGCKRISHCHPFKLLGSKEGFDPVPPKK